MSRATYFVSFALLIVTSVLHAEDWPQWRGPARTGHVLDGVAVPEKLPTDTKVVWHIPAGFGLASPVVSGGRAFYIDTQQGREAIHAVDAATGKEKWSVLLEEAHKDNQSQPGPRCTPLVDGDLVYVQATRGVLHCFNVADGKPVWTADYIKDFGATYIGEMGKAQGATRHGYCGSPLIDGDHLIAEVGGQPGAGVVCFDKQTGKVIWKSLGDIPAYSSPILATVAGSRQFIAFMVEGVIALNPDDGALLWRVPLTTALGRHVTTPVVVDDMVVVASHQVGLVGIKVTKDGTAFKADKVYAIKDEAINFSSPVTVGQFLYSPGPRKNMMCIDALTGKQTWSKDGLFAGDAGHLHAGLLVMGKNILALTDGGQLILFAANPEAFHEIGHLQACSTNWCIPAYADGKIYLRDAKEIRCIQLMP